MNYRCHLRSRGQQIIHLAFRRQRSITIIVVEGIVIRELQEMEGKSATKL
jgi:hypothetical protein